MARARMTASGCRPNAWPCILGAISVFWSACRIRYRAMTSGAFVQSVTSMTTVAMTSDMVGPTMGTSSPTNAMMASTGADDTPKPHRARPVITPIMAPSSSWTRI